MEEDARTLYTPETLAALRSRERRCLRGALLLAGLTLAVCIALCFGIRTRNAPLRQGLVIACSALGSWMTVLLVDRGLLPARREAAHEEGVARAAAETHTGRVARLEPWFTIPKSVTFVPVVLEEAEGEVSLKLNARFLAGFPEAGRRVRLQVRRGYITGWEVEPR